MPRFRHVGPIDSVEVPLLRRVLVHGDEFDVDADLAPQLLEQPDNFAPVAKASAKANPAQEG